MTQFKINKKEFAEFLKKCMFNGTIKFRDGKAVNKPMFSCFYLDVDENQLEVLAIDTWRKKVRLNVIKSGVEVGEPGVITIQDPQIILDILNGKGLGKSAEITVRTDGIKLLIESDTDGYEIKQKNNKDIKILQDEKFIKQLTGWKSTHFENEDGLVQANLIDPKTKQKVTLTFDTKIEVDKEELLKVVDDAINITKDNKTKIVIENKFLNIFKGEANSKVKSVHSIPFKALSEAILNFSNDFYNMQTIIPNLYDKIIFNIRRIATNDSIALQIASEDPKSKIKVVVAIASIV